jgi:hypothetical protein
VIVILHSYISAKIPKGVRGGAVLKAARALALSSALGYIKYIQHRPGKDKEDKRRDMFTDREDSVDAKVLRAIVRDSNGRGVVLHKLTIAPEVNPKNPEELTREVMAQLSAEKGQDLDWWAVCHRNTEHHHIHVVVLPKDRDGRQVRFDKNDYDLLKEYGDDYLERTQYADCRSAELQREHKRKEKQKQRQNDFEKQRQERIMNGEELPWLHKKIVREQLQPYSEWIKNQPNDSRTNFEYQGEKYSKDDKLERLNGLKQSLRDKTKKEDRLSKEDYKLLDKWIETKDRAQFSGELHRQFNNAEQAAVNAHKRAKSPSACRYVHPLQQQMMKNPVMGLFFSVASLAADVVRSIPLTEDPKADEDNKKKRKKDIDRDLDNMW